MSTIKEKSLFLYTVLSRNVNLVCDRNEHKKRVNVYHIENRFDFQTLTFIHNYCNSNSAYYCIKKEIQGSICLTVDFI